MILLHCTPYNDCNKHKFQANRAGGGKVILRTSQKCCKDDNKREITQRRDELELWFFRTALCIIATNTDVKFQVNQTRDDKVMLGQRTGRRLYAHPYAIWVIP